jgi:YebC/PmpR family DNA-binding regulatory protein
MSGHSKWATIKRKKGKLDAERGKTFTKAIKEITIAARDGGGDPEGNPRLRTAILLAKGVNMPAENIKRAIQKGTGELPGVHYEEHTYEGYGPGGVALFIEVLTDNKNRTTAEIRHLLGKHGGRMGEGGCVAHMFDRKGFLTVEKGKIEEDRLIEVALDGGAEDVSSEEPDVFEVYTAPAEFYAVQKALEAAQIPIASAELSRIPQNTTPVGTQREAEQILRIMELLEDHDDVQKVWSNFDIPAEMLEKLSG